MAATTASKFSLLSAFTTGLPFSSGTAAAGTPAGCTAWVGAATGDAVGAEATPCSGSARLHDILGTTPADCQRLFSYYVHRGTIFDKLPSTFMPDGLQDDRPPHSPHPPPSRSRCLPDRAKR